MNDKLDITVDNDKLNLNGDNDTFVIHAATSATWFPKYKSELRMLRDDSFVIARVEKKPNWWWRMWQFLLLGFKWDDVE